MRLYNVNPVQSLMPWKSADGVTPVRMKGIWLGSRGREAGFLHNFVPVLVHSEEPKEDAWGVKPSQRGKPKIVANEDRAEGWLAVLSSYGGPGPVIGQVLVSTSHRDHIRVLSAGVGGTLSPPCQYREYLVKVFGPADFLVIPTDGPSHLIRFSEKGVSREVWTEEESQSQQFVLLSDSSVPKWRNPNGESERH